MTASEIQTIISTLEAQLGSAAGRQRFQDREIEWRSTDELINQITYFKGLLTEADPTATPKTRFIRMSTRSGY